MSQRHRNDRSSQSSINWPLLAAGGIGALCLLRRMRQPSYSMQGKTVLVTGGSRGLGLVLARELIAQGARVAICARDQEELDRAFDDLTSRGGRVLAVPCDVTDRNHVEEMIGVVLDRFGRIDVLVNNAGIITVGPQECMTVGDYERSMGVMFWGPLYTVLATLPAMRRQGQGRIVNIASVGGKLAVPHLLPYSAAKFALVGLSQGLRSELAKDNIVVTTVCPGLMRTGSPRNASFKGQHEAEYTWFNSGDLVPGLAISAESAARQVVAACRRGDAEVILGPSARVAVAFHELFPNLSADLLALVNRLLPEPGGIGQAEAKGKDSETPLTKLLAPLSERAARRNNEYAPEELAQAAESN